MSLGRAVLAPVAAALAVAYGRPAAAAETAQPRPQVQPTTIAAAKAQILVNKAGGAVLTGISPSKGKPPAPNTTPSYKLTISGAGFKSTPQFRVLFTSASGKQDLPALPIAATDTQIDVYLPSGAKTGPIAFEPTAPLHTVTSSFQFAVLSDPIVKSWNPATVRRGQTLTVVGGGFGPWDTMEVRFGCIDLNRVQDCLPAKGTKKTESGFQVVVPVGAKTGVLQVMASTPAGDDGFMQTTTPLTVDVPLDLASLDHYKEMRGRNVTLLGGGFLNDPAFAVYFTGASGQQDQLARIWNRWDRESMVYVPDNAKSGKIRIVSGTGAASKTTTSTFDFNVMEPLQVTGLSPSSGPRGATVRITGKNFLNRAVLTVQFWNGQDLANQSATIVTKTDTYVDVVVPAGAGGTGSPSVTSGLGSDFETVRSPGAFTVTP